MIRAIDWKCTACGKEVENALAHENEERICACGKPMAQIWWKRPRGPAQWSDQDSIMIHVDPRTGDIRYPGRHDATLKSGYERVYLRSLAEVNRFEREHGVVNHVMHYDSNGRAIDDYIGKEKATH